MLQDQKKTKRHKSNSIQFVHQIEFDKIGPNSDTQNAESITSPAKAIKTGLVHQEAQVARRGVRWEG